MEGNCDNCRRNSKSEKKNQCNRGKSEGPPGHALFSGTGATRHIGSMASRLTPSENVDSFPVF